MVDSQGGSRTCQVFRHQVRILRGGSELLQASYLDPALANYQPQRMYRLHTTCCHTPMAAAYWGEALPTLGLYAANMRLPTTASDDGDTRNDNAVLFVSQNEQELWDDNPQLNGRVPAPEYRQGQKYAVTDKSRATLPKGHDSYPFGMVLQFVWRALVQGKRKAGNADSFLVPLENAVARDR